MRFSRQVLVAIASAAVVASVISFVAPSAYAAWTSSATATFSQSVPTAAIPTVTSFLTCVTDTRTDSATLTWAAAPATFDGMPFYNYFIEWNYATGTKASILTATRTGAYATPTSTGMTGTSTIHVTVEYGTAANTWKSPVSVSYNFAVSTNAQNGDKSPVCSPEKTS
jgi:hypothetical protein